MMAIGEAVRSFNLSNRTVARGTPREGALEYAIKQDTSVKEPEFAACSPCHPIPLTHPPFAPDFTAAVGSGRAPVAVPSLLADAAPKRSGIPRHFHWRRPLLVMTALTTRDLGQSGHLCDRRGR